ncbi:MAG: hypothetical protein ACR2N3_16840 [Pyrinomonadaceae bacterium]
MVNNQLNRASKVSFYESSYFWQTLLLFFIALLIWLIFYPGLFSNDSANQYGQAINEKFTNWHPPLMAIVLSFVLKLGGNVGLLILLQCAAAILGVRSLTRQFLISFFPQSNRKIIIITTLVPLFLLIPVTPFLFYTVTFWKDVWTEILFLWIIAYLLWLNNNSEKYKFRGLGIHLLFIACLSSLLPLIRHNAIIVLPIIGFSLLLIVLKNINPSLSGIKKITAFSLLFIPLCISLLVQFGITRIFNIKDLHTEDGVKEHELFLLLKSNPELSGEFPITAHHIDSPMVFFGNDDGSHFALWNDSTGGAECPKAKSFIDATSYSWENLEPLTATSPPPCFRLATESNEALGKEYWTALKNYPAQLLKIKLHQFTIPLNPQLSLDYVITKDITDYAPLNTNQNFKRLRSALYEFFENIKSSGYLLYGLNIHALWLVINIGFTFKILFDFVNKKNKSDALFRLSILLIPFSYYLSYFLVTVATDYRFMYPSTLIIQILVISLLQSKILSFLKNRRLSEIFAANVLFTNQTFERE